MALQIDLQVSGLAQAQQQLRAIAGQYQQIGRANQQVARQARSAPGGGPFSNLQTARANLQQAMGGGSVVQQGDAQYRLIQAQQRAAKAQELLRGGPGMGGKIMDAVMSSRVGFGAGGMQIMPLVSRLVRVLGPAGMLLAAGFEIITGAASAFGRAVGEAAQAAGRFVSAATLTGGSVGDVAHLRAFGVSDPGAAGAFRERIAGGGLPASVAASMGVVPRPAHVGNQNYAADLRRALDTLGKMTNKEEQLRRARILGLDAYVDEMRASERVRKERIKDAEAIDSILDGKTAQQSRDLNVQTKRLRENMEALKMAFGSAVFGDAERNLNSVNNALRDSAVWLAKHREGLRLTMELLLMSNPLTAWLGASLLAARAQGQSAAAQQSAAAAIEKAANAWKPGIYGGGARGRSALGGAFEGYYFDRAMEGHALRRGAFSL